MSREESYHSEEDSPFDKLAEGHDEHENGYESGDGAEAFRLLGCGTMTLYCDMCALPILQGYGSQKTQKFSIIVPSISAQRVAYSVLSVDFASRFPCKSSRNH